MKERESEECWWKKYAVYQIYPRSFKDSTGDGIGDIRGIIQKLDYLEWLGIRIVWLSSVFKSPMADFGFDISDYRDIDPIFGSIDVFKDLIREMHERGMYLVMDLVVNHTSDQHDWFTRSKERTQPYEDYYVWHDAILDPDTGEKSPPNNWQSVFGGSVWTWCERREQYYLHNFLPQQPDLNHRNPSVRKEVLQILEYWLELGVDGFRADAVSFLMHDETLKEGFDNLIEKPETFSVIKEWVDFTGNWGTRNEKKILFMSEAYASPEHMKSYYRTGLDLPFNFSLSGFCASRFTYLTTPSDWIGEKIRESMAIIDKEDWWLNWVTANHDQKRLATRLGYPIFTDVSNMLLLLLPGTPICYYGEELGLRDVDVPKEQMKDPVAFRKDPSQSRDPSRSPMPWNPHDHNAGFTSSENGSWLPQNTDYQNINVESQKSASDLLSSGTLPDVPPNPDLLHLHNFRQLLKMKQEDPLFAQNSGKNLIVLESGSEDVVMFIRFPEQEEVSYGYLIILEFGLRIKSKLTSEIPPFELNFGPQFKIESGTLIFSTSYVKSSMSLNLKKKLMRHKRVSFSATEDINKEFSFDQEFSLSKGQGLIFKIDFSQKNQASNLNEAVLRKKTTPKCCVM